MSKEKKSINELLSLIQTTVKVPKNQYNGFGKYKYRNCEDILEGLKPVLKEYGCAITLSDEMVVLGDRYYIKATACLSEGEEKVCAYGYAREALDKKGMDASQITGSTSSYARKYALQGLFALDDNKDADSMDNSKKPAPVKTKAKQNPLDAKKKEILKLCNELEPKLVENKKYVEFVNQAVSEDLKNESSYDNIISKLQALLEQTKETKAKNK